MQRILNFLACFFICANCFAQQYPFVHYTPKDGLISNMIKGIYQDSKGRLYFNSVHGLSVYDGSSFTNYNSKNGLGFDIVNCVMEMGIDSLWIVTNSSKINCLVNGKMKLLPLHNEGNIINNLCKDEKGDIYAAAEEGLLIFDRKDRFVQLPFVNMKGENVSSYILYAFSVGDYLIVQRDGSLLPEEDNVLYLYSKTSKTITSEMAGIYGVQIALDGRIWASTEQGVMAIDANEIQKGKIVLQDLPEQYAALRNKKRYFILFDNGNNCWLGDQNSIFLKVSPEGAITTFTSVSGLSMFYINSVFRDREGITWIATNNDGVSKLVHNNFSHIENPFDLVQPSVISYNQTTDNMIVYSASNATAAIIHENKKNYFGFKDQKAVKDLVETPYGFFAIRSNTIYKLKNRNKIFYAETAFTGSVQNFMSNSLVDKNGNLLVTGKTHLTAIIKGNIIFKTDLPFYADFPVMDSKGNIWVTTRANDLLMYQAHPDDPSHYLEQKLYFKNKIPGFSPRSIIIDKNDDIWIGTRNHGIHVYSINDGKLAEKFSITTSSGLSDEFTSQLACDEENNIWACSALGLDKITIKDGTPVVENITRQNNIFQSVFRVVVDKNNVVWGLVSNGLIRITPEKKPASDYVPVLMVSMVKAGKDTVSNQTVLSHSQNNLNFYFAATSYFNEKQVLYSYRLNGGSNNQWSDPSNIASVSFIDLPPGDYILDIKANFPASRYPGQTISYKFAITPAWWQTWWFRSVIAFLIVGVLFIGSRFYYRRKLEKKMALLEKQQAIEKERTRIATDMHDDLGAGLSRIKFLSETIGLKKQKEQAIDEEISSIRDYSHEMIDKMGEIVWALNEKNDTLSDLLSYTRSYSVEYLSQNGINCRVQAPEHFPSGFVSGEFRRNIYLTVKEVLHNVVKHAQATEVIIRINMSDKLTITISDNGTGFDLTRVRPFSNGLNNMQSRINELNGKLEIKNDHGTQVWLSVPLPS